ncbi:MAG: DUF1778 domain-containing protein [Rhizobiaceae bacterium]
MPLQNAASKNRDLDERSSERMNFRVKPKVKSAIQKAAALSGVDDSVFAMSAAYRSALETIASHERTLLSPVDHAAFFEALEGSAQPNEKLAKALARHSRTIDQRS